MSSPGKQGTCAKRPVSVHSRASRLSLPVGSLGRLRHEQLRLVDAPTKSSYFPQIRSRRVVVTSAASQGDEADLADTGDNISEESLGVELCRIVALVAPGFLGFAYVLAALPEVGAPTSTPVTGEWKLGLIATHVFIFVLIPVAMRIFYKALPALNATKSGVFASQLGFSFIMVAIASEIGWHVTQAWFYSNDYTMLNFMFYYFLISGFALLGTALKTDDTQLLLSGQTAERISSALLLATSILYPLGAAAANDSYKIPIYISLTFVTSVLAYRSWRVLDDDWRVVLFPILSVGVNLFFIFLLDQYGDDVPSNALYHILHDLLGTEAGLAVLVWLFFLRIPEADLKQ